MHLIKSALLLILFACLPFSASAAPVAVAKNPLAATTPATTVSPGEQVNINTVDEAALIRGAQRCRRGQGQGDPRVSCGPWSVRLGGSTAGSERGRPGVAGEEPGADRHRVRCD